jgi:type I restriction enzyme S subunit
MKFRKFLFDEVTVNYDRMRVPLSSMQRKEKKGDFRYYGAQGVIDYVDDYIFVGEYLLIAEDGENLKSKKQNIAQIAKGKFWVNNHAHVLQTNSNCELRYLYYLINSMDLSGYITGSAQPKLSQANMNMIPLSIPTIEEQKKILAVIGTIDDKIEMNNAINNNLLEQAQTVFDQEFLALDDIPADWTQSSLLGIAEYLNGLAMQKYRPSEGEQGLPVLKIKELRQGSCDANSELCSPSIKPEYIVHDGDVIFSWSGSLLVDFWCGGTCGLNQHLFKVTSKTYDKWFYYAWTNHHLQKFAAIAADMATTMGHIKREELAKAEVLIPSHLDYKRIGSLLAPLYDLVISNRIENRKLASLRDELLPQLMTGQLDVSNLDI